MIRRIHVQNFLLIPDADIVLDPEFTVFTGESGSGKSLIFKALRFALGSRIDKSYIGPWDKMATVEIWIQPVQELGLNLEGEIHLRHTLSKDKRTCEINGQSIAIKDLKQLADKLVLDSAQGQSQKVQDLGFQRDYILKLSNPEIVKAFESTRKQVQDLETQMKKMQSTLAQEDEAWLSHQVSELSEKLQDADVVSRLQAQVKKLDQYEKVKKIWVEKQSQIQMIQKGLYQLRQVTEVPIEELVLEMEHTLEGIEGTFQSEMDMDAYEKGEALEAKAQLGILNDLARKHRVGIEALYDRYLEYQKTLEDLEIAKRDLSKVEGLWEKKKSELLSVSKALEAEQRSKAQALVDHMAEHLVLMGMEQADFKIEFEDREIGIDPIFYIQSNPGQPYKRLQDCLSCGEMSRLSILLTLYLNPHLTLILDEVDTGVSGVMGQRIRMLLSDMGKRQQILCISHLAQVASGASLHYVLSKSVGSQETKTVITKVQGDVRAIELSRLMSGKTDSDMVKQAKRLLTEPS